MHDIIYCIIMCSLALTSAVRSAACCRTRARCRHGINNNNKIKTTEDVLIPTIDLKTE